MTCTLDVKRFEQGYSVQQAMATYTIFRKVQTASILSTETYKLQWQFKRCSGNSSSAVIQPQKRLRIVTACVNIGEMIYVKITCEKYLTARPEKIKATLAPRPNNG
jgi:hypothetical protein